MCAGDEMTISKTIQGAIAQIPPGVVFTAATIADQGGFYNGNVRKAIYRAVERGDVTKVRWGVYRRAHAHDDVQMATTADAAFSRRLAALVGCCLIDGGVVEVRGVTLEDAYQYGATTSAAWPVVYGTLDEPALRPDEVRLLTPAAQAAVMRLISTSTH